MTNSERSFYCCIQELIQEIILTTVHMNVQFS